jgi:hypothetical protein
LDLEKLLKATCTREAEMQGKATCTREAEMQGKKGFHGIPLIFMELATTK